jgi:hypothetical protein
MDSEQLDQLKQRLIDGDDYTRVLQDFLDGVGNDPAFMDRGRPVEDFLLMHIIAKAGGEILGGSPRLENVILIQIPESNFIHGSFLLSGRIANVIYFPDIGVGVFAVIISLGNNPSTQVVRFSAVMCTDPSCN